MKTAKTPEEYYNYFGALSQFPSAELAKRTFELVLSPEVKNQDLYRIGGLLENIETQATAWELFKSNFPAIKAKSGANRFQAGSPRVAGYFCDEKLRDDSQDFFASQNLPGTERVLQNAKDSVNACIGLRSLQQANLSAYLKSCRQGRRQRKPLHAGQGSTVVVFVRTAGPESIPDTPFASANYLTFLPLLHSLPSHKNATNVSCVRAPPCRFSARLSFQARLRNSGRLFTVKNIHSFENFVAWMRGNALLRRAFRASSQGDGHEGARPLLPNRRLRGRFAGGA